ncbi:hypothetical protein Zmor_004824 [Zophobas morio]|uniref:Uncharacterized protein n=1 Tax=Zophobas morio TaxID=2755281 RepID=A0AA38IM28_9CUCU|nr:hypothetical protein Zmor_004824 [Zophobas morio]
MIQLMNTRVLLKSTAYNVDIVHPFLPNEGGDELINPVEIKPRQRVSTPTLQLHKNNKNLKRRFFHENKIIRKYQFSCYFWLKTCRYHSANEKIHDFRVPSSPH